MAVRLWGTGPLSRIWVFCVKCEKTSGKDVDKIHLGRNEEHQAREITIQCHGGKVVFEVGDSLLANLDHRLNIGVFGDILVGAVTEMYRSEPAEPSTPKLITSGELKQSVPWIRVSKTPDFFNPLAEAPYPEPDFFDPPYIERSPAPAGSLRPHVPVVPPPGRRRVILPEE